MTLTVAVVQAAPVFLDREATLGGVRELAAEAAAGGAGLVVFPETFIPGYPVWVWRTLPWGDDASELYGRLLDQAVVVPSEVTLELGSVAADHDIYLVIGVHEIERTGGTVYNSLLYFAPDGTLLHCHRKLMPTGPERLVWGFGDGSSLQVLDTPFGRLGGLICWENYMPLARAALYALGIDVYVAPTWDCSEVWLSTMRHIAREGRCYVLGVNSVLRSRDVSEAGPVLGRLYRAHDDWLSRGGSVIVGPDGKILAGPLREEAGILSASIDPETPRAARVQFDPAGHYARPDVFRLVVDDRRPRPVNSIQFSDDQP